MYSVLSNNAAIKQIAGKNVFPVTIPQRSKDEEAKEPSYPAVVFALISRDREQTHQGPTKLVRSNFVVSCIGRKYLEETKALADRVRLALNGKSGDLCTAYADFVKGVFVESEEDEYIFDEAEQLALYHVPIGVLIQHWEALA